MDFSGRQQEPGKKITGLALVIVFHIILGWALMNGLGSKISKFIQKPMEAVLPPEAPPPPPPPDTPPPPPPKLAVPPPPFIPPPEVQVQQQTPSPNAISAVSSVRPDTNVMTKAAPVEAPKTAAGPVVVAAKIDFKQAGCTPDYPRASLRNEETGTTLLSVTVSAEGNISSVDILKSSGFRGLDNAVRQHLMSGSCKNAIKPGTIDGKPQATVAQVNYVWSLDGN
ncbi:MAG: TonB family protein [Undibacterium sp.]|nr:TonB family protein [Undibacterium sp.]